jgi:hypothetical protein
MSKRSVVRVATVAGVPVEEGAALACATVVAPRVGETLTVRLADGRLIEPLCLNPQTLTGAPPPPGSTVLLALLAPRAVMLGTVGPWPSAPADDAVPPVLRLEAGEALTLACGKSSIELRADGRLMVKGEDVLVRASGTQRIRAGTVSIN